MTLRLVDVEADPPTEPTERVGPPPVPSDAPGPREDPLEQLLVEVARAPERGTTSLPGEVLGASEDGEREPARGDRIGRYEILRRLGQGGFGVVYLARDPELGRHVAVKVLRADRRRMDRALDLIHADAIATARLSHPNIITVFDVGTWGGRPFMVVELLEGEPLDRRLGRGPLSVREASAMAGQIARALVHAHQSGVIHRDLKPENVFVLADGRVKVLDFGLAALAADPGGAPTVAPALRHAGTPGYMAPEQRRGEPVDARTDVYALGTMLREMVLGREGAERALAERNRRPAGLPSALAAVIARATEEAADKRFATADALGRALAKAQHQLAFPTDMGSQPYRFLDAFVEREAAWFFGREAESRRLLGLVQQHAFVAVIGPSGAGKSSLLQAGLLPLLREERQRWSAIGLRPGRTPLRTLRVAVAQLCGETPIPDDASLIARPGLLGQALRRAARERGGRILVVVDALEEILAGRMPAPERAAFAQALLAAGDDPDGPVRVLVVLRSDAFGRLGDAVELGELAAAVRTTTMQLQRPGREALVQALVRPAQRLGYSFEKGLVAEIVRSLEGEVAPLPLLQLAGSRLWAARDQRTRSLRRDVLARLGGIGGLLAAHADDVVGRLEGEADVQLARRLLGALVDGEGTRRRERGPELLAHAQAPAADATRVLKHLVDGRLVTASREFGGDSYELVHETLLTRWPRLRAWLDEGREERMLAEEVALAARRWLRGDKDPELLWRGLLLERVARLSLAGADERAFVRQSQLSAARRRRIRRGALATVLGALALFAVLSREQAQRVGERLADALVERAHTAEARREWAIAAAYHAAAATQVDRADATWGARVAAGRMPVPIARLDGQGARIHSLAFTGVPELLCGATDAGVLLWEARTGRAVGRLVAPGEHPTALAPSPDGHRLAVGTESGTILLWDLDRRALVDRFTSHPASAIASLAYSPDGQRVVSGALDREVHVTRLDTHRSQTFVPADGSRVRVVAAGPDAVAFGDEAGGLWISHKGAPPRRLSGHRAAITSLSFLPSGRLASAGEDRALRLWDVARAAPLHELDLRDPITSLAFLGGEAQLVSGDLSQNVTLRDAKSGQVLARLDVRGGATSAHLARVSVSRDLVAATAADGGARLFHLGTLPRSRLARHEGRITSLVGGEGVLVSAGWEGQVIEWPRGGGESRAAFPPGPHVIAATVDHAEHRLAVARDDGAIVLGPLPLTGNPLLLHPDAPTTSLVFAGELLLSGGADGVVRAYDPRGTEAFRLAAQSAGGITGLAVSADGRTLVVASRDAELRVWDVASRHLDATLAHAPGPKHLAVFGHVLAVGGPDAVIRLWDLRTRARAGELVGHSLPVLALSFGAGGEVLLSGSADGSARLWDLRSRAELARLYDHTGQISAVLASRDGRWFATGGDDGIIQMVALPELATGAKARLGQVLSTSGLRFDGVRILEDGADR